MVDFALANGNYLLAVSYQPAIQSSL